LQLTKSQKRLLILLGIVLIYAIYDIFSNLDTYKSFYSGASTEDTAATGTDSVQTVTEESTDPLQSEYLQKWGKDPFFIFVAAKPKKTASYRKVIKGQTFELLAISIKGGSAIALINDKIVKQGDIIAGYQVLKITKKSVILDNGKKKITLVLKPY